jgi:glycosyltransferase involved in cell wall biosynthesis
LVDPYSVRVLHLVASRQRRGAEIFAADLVDGLASDGVTQQVVALRDHDEDIVSFNAPTSVLGANSSSRLRIDLRAIIRLRGLVHSWNANVLQAHGGEALKYAVPAALGKATPVCYRRIGSSLGGSVGRIRSAGYQRLVRRASVVVALSDAGRREMIDRFGVDERRAIRIPNAVNVERARPTRSRRDVRRVLGISDESEVVVSVGTLNWEKDPLAQLEVFQRVAKARPRAVFAMVGSGPLEADTRRATVAKGLEDRVFFFAPRNDIPDVLGASDVLLLASKTEGMPGILIEAGIARLPAAGYALSGVPEVVGADSTGLLARAGDVEHLATSVVELLGDANLRARMGTAAYERCVGEFSIRSAATRYLDVYRCLNGGSQNMNLEAADK